MDFDDDLSGRNNDPRIPAWEWVAGLIAVGCLVLAFWP